MYMLYTKLAIWGIFFITWTWWDGCSPFWREEMVNIKRGLKQKQELFCTETKRIKGKEKIPRKNLFSLITVSTIYLLELKKTIYTCRIVGKYSVGIICSWSGRAVSWLKAGVSSKQFWNSDTLANIYSPSLALDIATTKRRTSLQEISILLKISTMLSLSQHLYKEKQFYYQPHAIKLP